MLVGSHLLSLQDAVREGLLLHLMHYWRHSAALWHVHQGCSIARCLDICDTPAVDYHMMDFMQPGRGMSAVVLTAGLALYLRLVRILPVLS
jgi:hypothetical protein